MMKIFKNQKLNILFFLIAGILIAGAISFFSAKSAPIVKLPWSIKQSSTLEEGCQNLEIDSSVDPNKYNFVGTLDFSSVKPADEFLLISKDKKKRIFSLGKFKLPIETYTLLRISKLWMYFTSDKLSDRKDKFYGLEDSYLSRIILKVGNKERKIELGTGGEHMLIELIDCPLGNISPVNHETSVEFEILLEIGCNNFKDNACLDNGGKPLDYINGADLSTTIRFFVVSWEEFTKDIVIPVHFKYE